MSLLDSIKKGLFDQEDDYEDQYIDDGPQMVNNNNGTGLGADDENEEPATPTRQPEGVVRNPCASSVWCACTAPPHRV